MGHGKDNPTTTTLASKAELEYFLVQLSPASCGGWAEKGGAAPSSPIGFMGSPSPRLFRY